MFPPRKNYRLMADKFMLNTNFSNCLPISWREQVILIYFYYKEIYGHKSTIRLYLSINKAK